MRSTALLVSTFLIVSCADLTNYQTSGNLQALGPDGCVNVSALNNRNTPVDIFLGVRKCMANKDYPRAVRLYAVAGLYGRIDQLRVKDESAHQAISVLRLAHVSSFPKEDVDAFQQNLKSTAQQGSSELAALCTEIKRLGPPAYFPTYMVKHGMGAFLGGDSSGPLKSNFNMNEAWKGSLDSFLHCP